METFLALVEKHSALWILGIVLLCAVDFFLRLFPGKRHKEMLSGGENVFLRELTENDADIHLLTEMDTDIPVYVSENTERILGISTESVRRDPVVLCSVMRGETQRALAEKAKENSGGAYSMELPLKTSAGDEAWYELVSCPTRDGKYRLTRLRDISIERARRQELEQKMAEAKRSDESKTNFLSTMSHEIRTPMNGMLGMISLARMNLSATADAEDYLEKAESLSKFLLSVINDILDMSRIESGKIQLEAVPFDLRRTADKLCDMFQTSITEKGIGFEVECKNLKTPVVVGDELRITQVVTNFLSNSSKFTPAGGKITLTMRQMDVIDDKAAIMLRVRDTGKGMSPQFLHRIFKPFEQENSGIARRYGGSGLGMAIADNLVRLMGGQLLVDSEEGKGSEFTVFLSLPVAENPELAEEQDSKAFEEVSLEGRHILLAEDNHINAVIVVKMLSTQGISVEVAENGLIALQKFEQSSEGQYDAILMDIQMPEMDGWEATRRIRALSRPDAAKVPIFALSADAFVEDKRHSAEVGMNGHVTKPVNYQELKRLLQTSLQS